MWVLSPMLPTGSQRASDDGAALDNPVHFLSGSGAITIGRPAKKGGTTGKADILIFGEQSVSTVHATITVHNSSAPGIHGGVTIQDSSKYGTYVLHSGEHEEEQRVLAGQDVTLQLFDIIRFGTKCKFMLRQVPLLLCTTGKAATDPVIVEMAASCNASITNVCYKSSYNGNSEVTHCVVEDNDEATAAVLYCLLQGIQLVTPAWLAAVLARKTWPRSLPDVNDYSPKHLLLPQLPQLSSYVRQPQPQQQQQQQVAIDLASWQPQPDNLLAGHYLIMLQDSKDDLTWLAEKFGATVISKPPPLGLSSSAFRLQSGQRPVLVTPSTTVNDFAQEEWLGPVMPTISFAHLQHVIATGSTAFIKAAVQEFQRPARECERARDGSDDNATEDTHNEEQQTVHEQLQAVISVVHATKQHGDKQRPAGAKSPMAQQASTPRRTRAAKRGAAALADTAPAAPAAAAGAASGSQACAKRRKLAAAGEKLSGAAAAVTVDQPLVVAPRAIGQQQTQQRQQQISSAADASEVNVGTCMALLVYAQRPSQPTARQTGLTRQTVAAALNTPAVNFKAFKRKQQLAGHLQQPADQQFGRDEQQQLHQNAAIAAVMKQLVPFQVSMQGPDTDAFLKEERQRLQRLRKADELFHANIKPKAPSKPAASKQATAKTAARGRM